MTEYYGREWPVEDDGPDVEPRVAKVEAPAAAEKEPFLSSLPRNNVRKLTGRIVEWKRWLR